MTTQAAIDRYHEWVAKQPCMNCGIEGYSQVSHYEGLHGHLFGRGGSKKAHFMCVTSLCCERRPDGIECCHSLFGNNKLSGSADDAFMRKIDKSERHLCWQAQTIMAAIEGGVLVLV